MMSKYFIGLILTKSFQELSFKQQFYRFVLRITIVLITLSLLSLTLLIRTHFQYRFMSTLTIIFVAVLSLSILFIYKRYYSKSSTINFNDPADIRTIQQSILYDIYSENNELDLKRIFEKDEVWYGVIRSIIEEISPEREIDNSLNKRIGKFLVLCYKDENISKKLTEYIAKEYGFYFDKNRISIESFDHKFNDCFLYDDEITAQCYNDYSEQKEILIPVYNKTYNIF